MIWKDDVVIRGRERFGDETPSQYCNIGVDSENKRMVETPGD